MSQFLSEAIRFASVEPEDRPCCPIPTRSWSVPSRRARSSASPPGARRAGSWGARVRPRRGGRRRPDPPRRRSRPAISPTGSAAVRRDHRGRQGLRPRRAGRQGRPPRRALGRQDPDRQRDDVLRAACGSSSGRRRRRASRTCAPTSPRRRRPTSVSRRDGPFIVRGESGYLDLGYAFRRPRPRRGSTRHGRLLGRRDGHQLGPRPLLGGDPHPRSDATRAELETLIEQVTAGVHARRQGARPRGRRLRRASSRTARPRGSAEGDLVLVSHGLIAHSSIPDSGRNAVVEVALVGARIASLSPSAFQPRLRFIDQKIGLSTDGSGFGLERTSRSPRRPNTTASLDLVQDRPAQTTASSSRSTTGSVSRTRRARSRENRRRRCRVRRETRPVGMAFDAYYYPDGDRCSSS